MCNLNPRIPYLTSHLVWDATTSLPALIPQLTPQGPSVLWGDTPHENRKTEGSIHCPAPAGFPGCGKSSDGSGSKPQEPFSIPVPMHKTQSISHELFLVLCPLPHGVGWLGSHLKLPQAPLYNSSVVSSSQCWPGPFVSLILPTKRHSVINILQGPIAGTLPVGRGREG